MSKKLRVIPFSVSAKNGLQSLFMRGQPPITSSIVVCYVTGGTYDVASGYSQDPRIQQEHAAAGASV